MVETTLLKAGTVEEAALTYVVIGAREEGKWLFVRHRERSTWEMPAGHIEEGESADQAAVRELFEETGATESRIRHLCDYRVRADGRAEYGRLYGAEVLKREPLPPSEIAEVSALPSPPANLTYPEVQRSLFEEVSGAL